MILKALEIEIAPVTFIDNYPFNNALALLKAVPVGVCTPD